MATPYAEHVGDRNPVDVLRDSLAGYRAIFARYTPEQWAKPWAPGKWTAREVLVHVTQWEMIIGTRIRMALSMPGHVVQPGEQDPMMAIEAPAIDVATAIAAFEGLRRMNLALAEALSPAQRKHRVTHAERGEIDVEDLLTTLAGHGVHHLKQLG